MTLEGLTDDIWDEVEPAAKEALANSYDVSVHDIDMAHSEDDESIVHVEIEAETDLDAQTLSNTIQGIISFIQNSYFDFVLLRCSYYACSK